jgi:diguanylate cyclase (GGDEF)-like protein
VSRTTRGKDAARLAERLRRAVEETKHGDGDTPLSVTVSIGVAELGEAQASDAEGLMELADERLYRAKESGRNRVCST